MDVYEAIKVRKSVREFTSKPVPEAALKRILEAARLAPSACNRQEWRFIVVKDKKRRTKLAAAACNQDFVGQAPVVLVCCADTDEDKMPCNQLCYPIDVAIAIDHITLCAVAEGLGTCWIGAFEEAKVKKVCTIPRNVRVVELLPIGYAADPAPVVKKRLGLGRIVKKERWR